MKQIKSALNGSKIKSFSDSNICRNEEKVNPTSQEKEMVNQNIRTLMKAFHGCRKNCAECQEEAEWEPKIKQKEVSHA